MGNYSPGFGAAILDGLGAPVTPDNLTFLAAWAEAEGGSATWNPFNTTVVAPGSTVYNRDEHGDPLVRNYPSYPVGLAATVRTLLFAPYVAIVASLKVGTDALRSAEAVAASPWGTGAGVLAVLVRNHYKPSGAPTPLPEGDEMTPEDWTKMQDLIHDQAQLALREELEPGNEVSNRIKALVQTALVNERPSTAAIVKANAK